MAEGAVDQIPRQADAEELVAAACRGVLGQILRSPTPDEGHPLDEHLILDVEAVQEGLIRILRGGDPQLVAADLPHSTPSLVTVARAELLAMEGRSAEAVLEGLRALQALERQVRTAHLPDPDSDLRAWLTRPDAFELLVEVAHDLRSPLTSILFLSETIREGHSGDLNDVQRSQLGLIYSAALGLISVTSDVVELARDERNLVEDDDIKPFSVAEVVHGVAEMVRPMAEEKGVELRVIAPEHERGYGHPMALGRILLNLTTNALKFTDEGHVELGVARLSHRTLEFHVRDTGRGIPETQVRQLFQPFRRRMRGDSHFFSGSGLGLSICQKILRAMGSELEVETRPDWGTRFHFVLDASPPR